MLELPPQNIVQGTAAWVLIGVLHLGIPAVMLLLSFVRSRRAGVQARAADAQGANAKALAPGPACIHGLVEYAHGNDTALRVEVEQVGSERQGKGNRWSHTWTESSRRVTAMPFFVNDPRGRVRVEPDERTLLVDKLDRTIRKSTTLRTRIAELAKEEAVFVAGQLDGARGSGGAYREGEGSLVMRTPPNERLLVSTEPLGDRFRASGRVMFGFGIFFTAFFIVSFAIDLPFYLRVLAGHVETGMVTQAIEHRGKGSSCQVELELPNKKLVEVHTDSSVCSKLRKREGSTEGTLVKVMVVGKDSLAILGSEPGVHFGGFVISGVALLFGLVFFVRRGKPWYDAKLVDDGRGRLTNSK